MVYANSLSLTPSQAGCTASHYLHPGIQVDQAAFILNSGGLGSVIYDLVQRGITHVTLIHINLSKQITWAGLPSMVQGILIFLKGRVVKPIVVPSSVHACLENLQIPSLDVELVQNHSCLLYLSIPG